MEGQGKAVTWELRGRTLGRLAIASIPMWLIHSALPRRTCCARAVAAFLALS